MGGESGTASSLLSDDAGTIMRPRIALLHGSKIDLAQ